MKTPPAILLLALLPVAALRAQENTAATTPAATPIVAADYETFKKHLLAKLNQTVIPQIHFREANVTECLDYLKRKSAEVDTDSDADPILKNLRLIYQGPATDKNALTAPVPAPPEPKITLDLANIPLGEALHYIALVGHLQIGIDIDSLTLTALPDGQPPHDDPIYAQLRTGDATAITAKLNRITIPAVQFKSATARETLGFIAHYATGRDTAESDPVKRGINIIIVPSASTPDTARITLALKNATLGTVLQTLAQAANMKMTIDPHAIVLEPLPAK